MDVSLWPLGQDAVRGIKDIATRHKVNIEMARELYLAFGLDEKWIQCALEVGMDRTWDWRSELSLRLDAQRLAERIQELQSTPSKEVGS